MKIRARQRARLSQRVPRPSASLSAPKFRPITRPETCAYFHGLHGGSVSPQTHLEGQYFRKMDTRCKA
ncbi:hypothetical protein ACS0PU_011806 [Formica fusca]